MDLRLPPSLLGISKRNFRFVFQASRCLIYKVQKFFCSPLFRECLFILPDLVSFVKFFFNFFRSFSCFESLNSNFSKLFVRFRWPTGQLIYNTTSASPCQQVFSSFVNFIRKRWKKPVRRRACGGPPSQAALLGYHIVRWFVNHFFFFIVQSQATDLCYLIKGRCVIISLSIFCEVIPFVCLSLRAAAHQLFCC